MITLRCVAHILSMVAGTLMITISLAQESIQPITRPTDVDPALAEFGKLLFFDPRLSKSGFISCNSCHNLSMGGTDNLPSSIGHDWHQGPINSPTVLNAGYNIAQFWDGRAADLKEQAGGPIANPGEMASSHTLAIDILNTIPGYREQAQDLFGVASISLDNVTTAIAEFEKTLVTPNSRFDKWLLGDETALNTKEVAGYELFKASGCANCHNGPALGGSMFMKFGLVKPYETENQATGRFGVTGNEFEKGVFKVPTLRNIELTYPYFHDGAVKSLHNAVAIMGETQLGRTFSSQEIDQLVAFMLTLTGDQPRFSLPILPPSVAETPAPEPFD